MESVMTKSARAQRKQPHPKSRIRHAPEENEQARRQEAGEERQPAAGLFDYAYDFVGTGLVVIRT